MKRIKQRMFYIEKDPSVSPNSDKPLLDGHFETLWNGIAAVYRMQKQHNDLVKKKVKNG